MHNMVSVLLLLALFSVHHTGHGHAFTLTNYLRDSGRDREVNITVDATGPLPAGAAYDSTSRRAAGATTTSGEGFTATEYGYGYDLVQCTPSYQVPQTCQGFLGELGDEVTAVFNGTASAQHDAVRCTNLRCEYQSYGDSPVVVALAARPPTPPLPAPASLVGWKPGTWNAIRTGWAGNASILFATVLGALVAILVSTLIVYLWKKAQANQYAEEGDNSRSLLFELTTLIRRAAAAIFAEENKLGHGSSVADLAIYNKGLSLPNGAHTTVLKMARQMDLRSACAACVLLLTFSISLLPSAGATTAKIFSWKCDGTSYPVNSTYQSNVRSLLASLAANASSSLYPVGFATAVVGASPDTVWGLGLCRGDTNGTDCRSCLALAPADAFNRCQGIKDVTVYYDRCVIRYSFRDFLTNPDNQPAQFGPSDVNVTSNAGGYNALVLRLVGALSDWAAFNTTSRYAVGVMNSDQGFPATSKEVYHRILGLVQCTPDQAPEACRGCLQGLIDDMRTQFNGSVGGQALGVWCNLRFEVFEFFDSSPMLTLVASQSSPPPSPMSTDQTGGGNGTRSREYAESVSAIVLGVAVIFLSISTFFLWFLWRNGRRRLSYKEDTDSDASLLFSLATLRRATENFAQENKLGHGGFGAVYKGGLPDGRQIAVKRMDKASGQGLKELRNELLLVAKLRHNNLAKLLGVCLQGQEKLLVYEYLPNRSLDTFLFAEVEKRLLLDWATRYRIIYGTARGLLYLHEDSQIKIIHRDLKASNILLDGDMTPKISDFGLARLFNGDKTTTITSQVVGTLGYMAPEYAVLGHLSVKLDVYSFGVLILEIVTGRKNTDMSESAADESSSLLTYVWDHWLKGTMLDTVDPSLDCRVHEREVLKCIHLGLLCVQENPADRPTMLDVLVMLHDQAASFPAPSKPAFAYGIGDLSSDRVSGDTGIQSGGGAGLLSSNGLSSEFLPR